MHGSLATAFHAVITIECLTDRTGVEGSASAGARSCPPWLHIQPPFAATTARPSRRSNWRRSGGTWLPARASEQHPQKTPPCQRVSAYEWRAYQYQCWFVPGFRTSRNCGADVRLPPISALAAYVCFRPISAIRHQVRVRLIADVGAASGPCVDLATGPFHLLE